MKLKNTYIRIISLVLIFVLCSTVLAFANNLEYNDVRIYVGGTYKTTIALRSDGTYTGNTYFYVLYNSTTGRISLQMQGGQAIQTNAYLNIPDGFSSYFITSCSATQGGNTRTVDMSNTQQPVVSFSVADLYSPVYLYINSPQSRLATPVVSVSGNTISWSPVSGATSYSIQYSTGDGVYDYIATNIHTNNFVCNSTGRYVVKAVDDTGTYLESAWSTSVQVTVSSGGNPSDIGGLIDWFTSLLDTITYKVNQTWNSLTAFFSAFGTFFDHITAIIPTDLRTLLYSVFAVECIWGIIKYII